MSIRKIIRQTLSEYITYPDLKSIESYADDLFSDVGVDVQFSKHFLDRVNDLRNQTEITPEELKFLYKKAYDRYANTISKLPPGQERVLTDPQSNINVPFVMNWDGKSPDVDMVGKTVMRKKDFKSVTPKLRLEKEVDENIDVPINVGDTVLSGRFKNRKIKVKDIGKNPKGDITINGKPLLKVRIPKEINEHLLSEIEISPEEPIQFEPHDLGEEKQYIFYAPNGMGYHLSFKKSCLDITDINVINTYKESSENNYEKPCYDFIMVNFFPQGYNPNISSTFEKNTNIGGSLLLMGNILWLWLDFMDKYPNEKFFAFSADDRRMNLYSNVFKTLSDKFHIFDKKRYDDSYEHDMIILIKK